MTRTASRTDSRTGPAAPAVQRDVARYAWLFGSLAILLGAVVALLGLWPAGAASWALGLALGAYAIVNLVKAMATRRSALSSPLLFRGLVCALVGAVWFGPSATGVTSFTLVLGVLLLLNGLAGVFFAVAAAPVRGWVIAVVHGAVLMQIGLWALLAAQVAPEILVVALGISLALEGVWQIGSALADRRFPRARVSQRSPA